MVAGPRLPSHLQSCLPAMCSWRPGGKWDCPFQCLPAIRSHIACYEKGPWGCGLMSSWSNNSWPLRGWCQTFPSSIFFLLSSSPGHPISMFASSAAHLTPVIQLYSWAHIKSIDFLFSVRWLRRLRSQKVFTSARAIAKGSSGNMVLATGRETELKTSLYWQLVRC